MKSREIIASREVIASTIRACMVGMLAYSASFFVAAPEAGAVAFPLSNTPVAQSVLAGLIGSPVTGRNEAPFDFSPSTVGGDGLIRSEVYSGAGAAVTEYVYLYQVAHFQNSSERKIGGFALPWNGPAPEDLGPGLGTSFYRTNPVLVPADNVRYADGTVVFLFSDPANLLNPGKDSVWLGLVSPNPPRLSPVNVLDTDREELASAVYVPAPIPAALPLFLTALAGVGLAARRRDRTAGAVAGG